MHFTSFVLEDDKLTEVMHWHATIIWRKLKGSGNKLQFFRQYTRKISQNHKSSGAGQTFDRAY